MSKKPSIKKLLLDFFTNRPNEDIAHPDWRNTIDEEYENHHGRKPDDPWRTVRKLHEDGILIKVKKGVYRYDPESVEKRELEDFTEAQKRIILERDGYKCVICGMGEREGLELHVDHIRPKNLGGKAIIENGQTLCARHNFIKKRLKQSETGKKMFIKLLESARAEQDFELVKFCEEVLSLYDKYNINGHIIWKKRDE